MIQGSEQERSAAIGPRLPNMTIPGKACTFKGMRENRRRNQAKLMIGRYNSPHLGRMLSPDPLELSVLSSEGSASTYMKVLLYEPSRLNRYAYAWSSPISNVDPTGLAPLGFEAAINAARSLIAGHVSHLESRIRRYQTIGVIGAALGSAGSVAIWVGCTGGPLGCAAGALVALAGGGLTSYWSMGDVAEMAAELASYKALDSLLSTALQAGQSGDWDLAVASLRAASAIASALSGGPPGILFNIQAALADAERKQAEAAEQGGGLPMPIPDQGTQTSYGPARPDRCPAPGAAPRSGSGWYTGGGFGVLKG